MNSNDKYLRFSSTSRPFSSVGVNVEKVIFIIGIVFILVSVTACDIFNSSKTAQSDRFLNGRAAAVLEKGLTPSRCIKEVGDEKVTFDCIHGIFALDPNGTENPLSVVSGVNNESKTNIDKLHYSPNGRQIAYLECTRDLNSDGFCDNQNERVFKRLVVSNIDGTNRIIIGEGNGGMMEYPTWSPDGTAILYVKSEAVNPLATDLYVYSFASSQSTNLTNTPCLGAESQEIPYGQLPDCMETDNHWGADGTIVVVKNRFSWGLSENNKLRPKILIPNNIFSFPMSDPEQVKPVTSLVNLHLPVKPETSHCCFADPRLDRSGHRIFFAQFDPTVPGHTDSDIVAKDPLTGKIQALSKNLQMDLYPMQNNSGQLFWTRFDSDLKTTSYVVFDLKTGRESKVFDVFGAHASEFFLDGVRVRFEAIGWGDWSENKVAFPATISFPGEN